MRSWGGRSGNPVRPRSAHACRAISTTRSLKGSRPSFSSRGREKTPTFRKLERLSARPKPSRCDNLVEVRRIVSALAPAELDEAALAGALRRILDRLNLETGIRTEMHADASLPALPASIEVALLRTAQSALSNVRLHANATRVVMNLVDAEDAVRLDIVDDGQGFDADDWGTRAEGSPGSGYGLDSMRARLRELGGGLDIESTAGDGTALSAYVPLGLQPVRTAEARRMSVTVLLVDDHPVVRSGLRAILAGESDIAVIGEAGSGEEALLLCRTLHPDVVLCDLRLGDGLDGVATTSCSSRP